MPNYLAPFLQTMQAQANVADTKAQTQQRLMAVMQGQQQMDQQRKEADLLQGLVSKQGPGSGGQFDQSDDGFMTAGNPANPLISTLKSAQENINRAKQTAQVAAATGNYKNYADAQKQLDLQQKEKRLAEKEVYDDMQRRSKETAQIIGGVRTPEDLRGALAAIKANFGEKAAQEKAQQIAKALPNGIDNATPEQIQAAIAPVANQYATAGEQMTKKSAETAHLDRMASREETERYHDAEIKNQASSRAIQREGLSFRAAKRDARIEGKDTAKIEDKAQGELSKDPSLKNFANLRKGYEAAQNITDVMSKTGFSSTTGPMANSLMTEYSQAVNNYRSLVGGKWTQTQRKDFDSAFAKFSGYIQGIGSGKLYSPQAIQSVAEEMKRMYDEGNVAALRSTLDAKNKVYDRGGNPNVIRSPASVQKAVDSGKADIVVDNAGNKILRLGKTQEDYYYLRDRPKQGTEETFDVGE